MSQNSPTAKNVIEKLRDLEEEISIEAAGMHLPADPEFTALMARILASDHPNADIQILVSSQRKTTTTKQFYETETPGMVGLLSEQLQDLQRKLMDKISSATFDSAPTATTTAEESGDRGDAGAWPRGPADIQQNESVEEGFSSSDGAQTIAKKTTRIVFTSQSRISGADGYAETEMPQEGGDAHRATGGGNGGWKNGPSMADISFFGGGAQNGGDAPRENTIPIQRI